MGEGSTQGGISRFFFWLNVEVHSCGLAVRSLVEFLWLVESCRLGALSISSSLHALLYHRSLLIERDSSTVLFSRMASGETKCLTCIFFLLCCLSPPPPKPPHLLPFVILFFYLQSVVSSVPFQILYLPTSSLSHFSLFACSFISSFGAFTPPLSPPFSVSVFFFLSSSSLPCRLPIPTGRGCSPLTWPLRL